MTEHRSENFIRCGSSKVRGYGSRTELCRICSRNANASFSVLLLLLKLGRGGRGGGGASGNEPNGALARELTRFVPDGGKAVRECRSAYAAERPISQKFDWNQEKAVMK